MIADNAFGFNAYSEDETIEDIFRRVVSQVLDLDYDGCLTFIYDEQLQVLKLGPGFEQILSGNRQPFPYISLQSGKLGQSLFERRIQIVKNIQKNPRFARYLPWFVGWEAHSFWCVPILLGEKIYGAFVVCHLRERTLQVTDERFLWLIARTAATAVKCVQVQNDKLHERTEEIVRMSDKLSAVGQLAAGVAHEIRNPITAVKGFCRLMEDGATAAQARYLSIVQSELSRMESIVGEMMALAKPSEANFRCHSAASIVEEVVTLMSAEASLYNVTLELNVFEASSDVHCDVNQVKQVLVNVIKNAVEAIRDSGTVQLKVNGDGNWVEICAVDNGPGIAKENLVRLGKPFFTTKEQGTGLGLLVSRRIVQAHGGTLNIRSELGQGTTVLVRLPRASSSNPTGNPLT